LQDENEVSPESTVSKGPKPKRLSDDWLAIGFALSVLVVSFAGVCFSSAIETPIDGEPIDSAINPLANWIGKPLMLYVCGQSLNLILTLIIADLMFGVLFRDFIQ
jgi:hypothetical protein